MRLRSILRWPSAGALRIIRGMRIRCVFASAFAIGFVLLIFGGNVLAGPAEDEKEILRVTEVINAAWLKHDVATISPLIADRLTGLVLQGHPARQG